MTAEMLDDALVEVRDVVPIDVKELMVYRSWEGKVIKEKLKDSPNHEPKDVAEYIEREYGVKLNYAQARRAKEVAREQLQGSYKSVYNQLPYFCEKIKEANPDTRSAKLFLSSK